MRSRTLIVAVLLGLLPAAGGCTTNPATGEQSFTAFMSPQDELRVGAQEHPKLVQEMGGAYNDPQLAAYVDRVGQSLARYSEIPGLRYTFTIIDSEDVNAFALPGGYIHVTRGLLALADSEAELAGVLAHELGHVTARHAAQRYSRGVATGIGASVLGVLGAIAGLPSATGDVVNYGAQAYLQSYSRDQELQADMLAIRYMTRAGYDPQAMVSFFETLDGYAKLQAEMAGDPNAAESFDIMASHPRTVDRIEQAATLSAAAHRADQNEGRDVYLKAINGLLFGDAPQDGIRIGREFVHPGLRIAFTVPPGFALINHPQQVIARGPNGAAIVFDAERSNVARSVGPMTGYLAQVWGRQLALSGVEPLTINGFDAATGVTRQKTRAGLVDLRLVAIRTAPDQIFRFVFATPPDLTQQLATELRRTTYSFRRLTPQQAADVRPLRIKILAAKPGDDAQSLATDLPFGAFNLRWFRLLNGLGATQQVHASELIKTVSR